MSETKQPEAGVWWVACDYACPEHHRHGGKIVDIFASIPSGVSRPCGCVTYVGNACGCMTYVGNDRSATLLTDPRHGPLSLEPGDGPFKVRLTMERVDD